MAGLKALLGHLAGLALPVQCVGCGAWDTSLCESCAALAEHVMAWGVLDEGAGLGLWANGPYEDDLRRIVLAAKHAQRVDVDQFLVRAGVALGKAMSASRMIPEGPLWVVPAPSGFKRRFRGQMVAPVIAHGVAKGLTGVSRGPVSVVDAVALRFRASSQSGKSGVERRRNRQHSMRLRTQLPAGMPVVVVDDVVTTGATVLEMVRVCEGHVVGVAALCTARHSL